MTRIQTVNSNKKDSLVSKAMGDRRVSEKHI